MLERIFQVLAVPVEKFSPASQQQPSGDNNLTIELRDVTFGYLTDHPVLHGVTLTVQPGEHVALVGRTGAGKSSALQLLGGLYLPWSGTVKILGNAPNTLAEEERRQLVGVVPQVVQLFSGTIYHNLTLGDKTVTLEAVQRAASITGADTFIESLPQGYETVLGRGTLLSAGQRQLIALTRALVWDPAVLLLDEATAAVDSASEEAFRAALRAWVVEGHRSVLTVAHRLASAGEADRVLVMDAGRIVEFGPPQELLRRGGRFAALWELEAAGWDWQANPFSPGQ